MQNCKTIYPGTGPGGEIMLLSSIFNIQNVLSYFVITCMKFLNFSVVNINFFCC